MDNFAWFMAHGHVSEQTADGFRVRVTLKDGRTVTGEGATWDAAVSQARAAA